MREFRVSYFPRVNLLTKQHGQDLSPGHLRGLHHFIYGITVILCKAYFPENQLWGIMLLKMRVAVCLPLLPPPNISVLWYTPVSQEILVCVPNQDPTYWEEWLCSWEVLIPLKSWSSSGNTDDLMQAACSETLPLLFPAVVENPLPPVHLQ